MVVLRILFLITTLIATNVRETMPTDMCVYVYALGVWNLETSVHTGCYDRLKADRFFTDDRI